jgi:hypothetical protein
MIFFVLFHHGQERPQNDRNAFLGYGSWIDDRGHAASGSRLFGFQIVKVALRDDAQDAQSCSGKLIPANPREKCRQGGKNDQEGETPSHQLI